RITSSWWTPARLMAARWPRWTSSTGRSWFCSERTRTRCPAGSHSTSSPTRRLPEVTDPVTTVPCPWTMKLRSMGMRNHCLPVLAGLRLDRLAGADHEQGQVDAGGPGEHVLDEALVPGHVNDAQAVGRKVEDGEADVDGDAALLLLGEAVAVDAGEGLDQGGL